MALSNGANFLECTLSWQRARRIMSSIKEFGFKMPSLRSTSTSQINFVKKPHLAGNAIQNWKDKKISRAIVVAILLSLLATSTPAAPQTIAEAATRGGAVTKRLLNSIRTRRLTSGVQREDNGMPPSPVIAIYMAACRSRPARERRLWGARTPDLRR